MPLRAKNIEAILPNYVCIFKPAVTQDTEDGHETKDRINSEV